DVFREKGITDGDNYFTGIARYNSKDRIHFDSQLVDAIYNEWELQLEKLYENDIPVSHIDSHNHVHYRYELFFVLKRLQKKFDIARVRIKDVKPIGFYGIFNSSLPRKTPPLHREFSNLIWNMLLKTVPPPVKTADHVFSYRSLCKYLSTGSRCPKRGVFEIVVHPGSDYLDYFSEENSWVENKKLEQLLPDFSMITYHDL
ncbi:MAG TPA: ChbG/HpnK family deacetylase, partial [Chloroflexi bacterium]|nr:ChbG/HpnK family deacetylase [Chloroflexota bacterium]